MANKLISIVIPEYNGSNEIKKCLDAIDNQTYSNYEVIIIDDCSPDNSYSLIKKHLENLNNKEKFQIIQLEHNSRAGYARNYGIKKSNGDYIVFIDQDDYPDYSFLEKLYSLSDNGTKDCVLCDILEKDKSIYQRPSFNGNDFNDENRIEFLKKCGYVFAILIKKELILKNNLFFPEGVMFEDTLYNFRLFLCVHSLAKLDEPLFYRRGSNNSQTSFFTKQKIEDRIKSVEWYLKQNNNCNNQKFNSLLYSTAYYYIYASCIIWISNNKELYDKEIVNYCYDWVNKNSQKIVYNELKSYLKEIEFPNKFYYLGRLYFKFHVLFYINLYFIDFLKKIKNLFFK